jgi:type I restriction enzyme M protein
VFADSQIAEIKKIYASWQTGENYSDTEELCASATIGEIRKQNYSLAPSKYIEFIDHDLEINYASEMRRIQGEMREVLKAEKLSQSMLKKR